MHTWHPSTAHHPHSHIWHAHRHPTHAHGHHAAPPSSSHGHARTTSHAAAHATAHAAHHVSAAVEAKVASSTSHAVEAASHVVIMVVVVVHESGVVLVEASTVEILVHTTSITNETSATPEPHAAAVVVAPIVIWCRRCGSGDLLAPSWRVFRQRLERIDLGVPVRCGEFLVGWQGVARALRVNMTFGRGGSLRGVEFDVDLAVGEEMESQRMDSLSSGWTW